MKWRVYTWTVVQHSCGTTVDGRTTGGALINRMGVRTWLNAEFHFTVRCLNFDNGGRTIIVNRFEPNGFFGGRTVYEANLAMTKIERIRQLDQRQAPTLDATFSYSSSGNLIQVQILTLSVNNGSVVNRQTLGPGVFDRDD